jgi:ATP-binding cassette subfamily B protein
MSTGNVMAAVTYTTQVVTSIMMVTMMFQSVSRALASAHRVREVLDTEPVIVDGAGALPVEGDVAVSFRGVSFRYPETVGEPVLHDINLDIKRGETLAIVGETGSGKSSLVQMIPRFYDATEGEILVEGVPIKDYKLNDLRHKISFVLQKSELFAGSISDNVRWGDPDANDEAVKDAAIAAQADAYIGEFADGYDTPVAEKGTSLSGGQKQRLSIARALVRNPEILIFDDATSALDLVTEAKLRAALRERMQGATVIMVAQRIASIKHADRIAVIEDGTIRHCAPHEELLKISETYRDIYASQMGKGGEAV